MGQKRKGRSMDSTDNKRKNKRRIFGVEDLFWFLDLIFMVQKIRDHSIKWNYSRETNPLVIIPVSDLNTVTLRNDGSGRVVIRIRGKEYVFRTGLSSDGLLKIIEGSANVFK
jgi:hypothetical protein